MSRPPDKRVKPARVHGPNPIDQHVGLRVRMRRKALGLSQSTLSSAIGLTFQQMQKYERGQNRISASKLYEIAAVLKTPVHVLFDGLEHLYGKAESTEGDAQMRTFLLMHEGAELMNVFPRLSASLRRRILELVRTMASEQELRPAHEHIERSGVVVAADLSNLL